MSQLEVELVAADGKVWEGAAGKVIARGIEGDIGILPGHTPLLTVLGHGEVRIDGAEGPSRTVVVDGGFLSVDQDRVTIVTETSESTVESDS